jgi:hypothetical protein
MTNPLEPVWQWYQVARDSMRVATRAVNKKAAGIITKKHVFHSLSAGAAMDRLREAEQELNNLAIVGMVAVFDRTLRDHLIQLVLPSLPATDSFRLAIQEQIRDDIDYWNLPSRIIDDLFKKLVPGDLCGMVKQIILYRNDVAHGHVAGKPPPGYADPPLVFQRLTKFLQASQIT